MPTNRRTTIRSISATTARRLAIAAQRLGEEPPPSPGPDELLDVTRAIRCLQLDPISVVARSHQLVLWSRVGPYDLRDLDRLLWIDRSVFEYWAYRASIVLTEDYQIHRLLMRSYPSGDRLSRARTRAWLDANRPLERHVMRRLRVEGPLSSRAFDDVSSRGWSSSGWTNERNVSRMLDILWTQGRIMVAGREGIQKLWDVSERCLPAWTPRAAVAQTVLVRRAAEHSLRSLGVGTARHINDHFTSGRYPGLPEALARLERERRIAPVIVRDDGGEWPGRWFVHTDHLATLERIEAGGWEPRTTLLSPFDNLIISRPRMEALFGFSFRMEIYVPKELRRYGYYAMPILDGDRVIGLVDPAMDRDAGVLRLHGMHSVPGVAPRAATGRRIAEQIRSLARFLGATDVRVAAGDAVPNPWRRALAG